MFDMETRDFFVQKTIKLDMLGEGQNYVYSNSLLDLINDDEVKEYIVEKYELEEEVKIEFDKIDKLLPIVKKYVSRFKTHRIQAATNNVTTSFSDDAANKDVLFTIREGVIDGAEVDELDAIAIYDSVNMFYKPRRLSQYINFLKNDIRDPRLLFAVNSSWDEYYEEKKLKTRLYRILEDNLDEGYYLKSINSDNYKEYGVAETFVLTILELHRISKVKSTSFYISSIALSESKIEIILHDSNKSHLKELGYIYPSISIRNEDQGNTSIGFYSSLEFKLANVDDNGKIHFFPNKNVKDIETKKTLNHTVTVKTFVDSYESIQSFFHQVKDFKEDFYFLKKATTPDQLRAKIEEKIVSSNSPFRNIQKLKDLFTREKAGHINNLARLLHLCGKAEMIDMDYDLKFRLRYLISNVLLYGKNDLK